MKIDLFYSGPVVGSSVRETIDLVDDWGYDPDTLAQADLDSVDDPTFKEIEGDVSDWANQHHEYGRSRSDSDAE